MQALRERFHVDAVTAATVMIGGHYEQGSHVAFDSEYQPAQMCIRDRSECSTSFSKFAAVIFSSAMRKAPFCYLCLFFVFQLANTLRHGSHRTKRTPCPGPVSYTHLDVYKRQRPIRSFRSIRLASAQAMLRRKRFGTGLHSLPFWIIPTTSEIPFSDGR